MSTGAQPLPHRIHWSRRRALWLVVVLALAAATAVGIDRAFLPGAAQPSRPELQQILDGLVQRGEAPGVTAYVTGPRGTWLGSAGVADVATGAAMPADARMRIESNSKAWLTAVILQLAQEGKLTLDDTVEEWLPGLLRDHGDRITIRQLLHDSSGLIDDNDVFDATPRERNAMLARADADLRAELRQAAARLTAQPLTAQVSPLLFIRLAAWQPLVAPPGATYHHSNIGWNVAGLIAAKAGGKPLPVLYRERLFEPLDLEHTAFSPQGPIAGPHARGYGRAPDGRLVDTTASHPGKFSDGAIVTNAEDEAGFLRAAMDGTLFDKRWWLDLYSTPASSTGCGMPAYAGTGQGNGYRSYAWYDATGRRVAVLLLNGSPELGDATVAALRLYCAG